MSAPGNNIPPTLPGEPRPPVVPPRSHRSALLRSIAAVLWCLLSFLIAERAARGFSHGDVFPLLRNLFNIFLLLLGFSYMEVAWERSPHPLAATGFQRGVNAGQQFAWGVAIGWGIIVGVMLANVLFGQIFVAAAFTAYLWRKLLLEGSILITEAMMLEIAFRGYAFKKLAQAISGFGATLLAGVGFALLRLHTPGATPTAVWISGVAAVVLSVARLRTGGLWMPWGLHAGWLVSIALLFGQPLAGNRSASAVIHTSVNVPTWISGGEYGPEASLVALLLLGVALYFVLRIPRWITPGSATPQLQSPAFQAVAQIPPGGDIN
jgi:membrane protease YdiL (CAAX protease family)